MNLVNIVEHLLDLTGTEFSFVAKTTTITSSVEIFTSQQLFEMLKAFKHSCFNQLHIDDPLEFDDEYDNMMDEESSDESDYLAENQDPDLRNHFTLEEMKSTLNELINIQIVQLPLYRIGFEKLNPWFMSKDAESILVKMTQISKNQIKSRIPS